MGQNKFNWIKLGMSEKLVIGIDHALLMWECSLEYSNLLITPHRVTSAKCLLGGIQLFHETNTAIGKRPKSRQRFPQLALKFYKIP